MEINKERREERYYKKRTEELTERLNIITGQTGKELEGTKMSLKNRVVK